VPSDVCVYVWVRGKGGGEFECIVVVSWNSWHRLPCLLRVGVEVLMEGGGKGSGTRVCVCVCVTLTLSHLCGCLFLSLSLSSISLLSRSLSATHCERVYYY
jgi:hypothetical protein